MIPLTAKSKAFLWKYRLIRPDAKAVYQRALHDQFLPPEELEEVNWRRTKALVEYAFEKVPFYRNKYAAAGLSPGDLQRPEDFRRLPVLTRQDLRDHFEEMISSEAKRSDLRLVTTGGSTGQPVKVYHQKRVVREAMRWRMLRWWGLLPGEDVATVYRRVGATPLARLVRAAMWWPTRTILLDATGMDEAGMRRFLKAFSRVRPRLLHGYVGAMDHLASFMLEKSLSVPPPKAIWVTSAPLTAVHEKKIQSAFGAPVYDQYGCCEVYWLAAQCPAKGPLHMFHDARRIEFLDDDGRPQPDGVLGRVAVTDLENYYFPLIRYLNGDMGRRLPGLCPCGVTLPLMDKVKGRTTDLVRLPSGKCISGEYLTTLFDEWPNAVLQFRVHQKADYAIVVSVVPNRSYPGVEGILARVIDTLKAKVAGEAPVRLEAVQDIPQDGGKLRFVRSDVR